MRPRYHTNLETVTRYLNLYIAVFRSDGFLTVAVTAAICLLVFHIVLLVTEMRITVRLLTLLGVHPQRVPSTSSGCLRQIENCAPLRIDAILVWTIVRFGSLLCGFPPTLIK